jgi:hypothetical protein
MDLPKIKSHNGVPIPEKYRPNQVDYMVIARAAKRSIRMGDYGSFSLPRLLGFWYKDTA